MTNTISSLVKANITGHAGKPPPSNRGRAIDMFNQLEE